jgi:hypothetical protein
MAYITLKFRLLHSLGTRTIHFYKVVHCLSLRCLDLITESYSPHEGGGLESSTPVIIQIYEICDLFENLYGALHPLLYDGLFLACEATNNVKRARRYKHQAKRLKLLWGDASLNTVAYSSYIRLLEKNGLWKKASEVQAELRALEKYNSFQELENYDKKLFNPLEFFPERGSYYMHHKAINPFMPT